MTILGPAASSSAGISGALRFAPALFATTLFVSALLLFLVQPMFTKMVLPRLGGAPAVWSVAMVFFQAALLAGYAYAHLIVRRLTPGAGALVHLGVLALSALMLPIGIASSFEVPPSEYVALWLMGLLAVSVGLPFAALSASAPLLQGWFAASGHPKAGNPYVLYAASNLGSFAALIAYPVVVEPMLPLADQSRLWSVGFAGFALLAAAASLFVANRPGIVAAEMSAPVSLRDRMVWTALAAIPSGLVIAVTSYISTDVAAAPFLWMVPLALYLLTFVAVFRDRPWIPQSTVIMLVPILMAPLTIGLLGGGDRRFWLAMILVNLAAFLLLALLCHRELYERRPAPARLTEFYLWVSFGGVVGGIFAALIAPYVFNRVYEYPVLLLAGLLAMPGVLSGGPRRFLAEAGPVLGIAALAIAAQLTFGFHLRRSRNAAISGRARRACRRHAVSAPPSCTLLRAGGTGVCRYGAVAARLQSRHVDAQLLRSSSRGRDQRQSPPAALSRHHAAWRRAYRSRRRRNLRPRTADVFLLWRADLRSYQCGARGARRARPCRGRRARHRQPGVSSPRRRAMDILRDRSRRGPHRARSAVFQVPVVLRT